MSVDQEFDHGFHRISLDECLEVSKKDTIIQRKCHRDKSRLVKRTLKTKIPKTTFAMKSVPLFTHNWLQSFELITRIKAFPSRM